MIIFCFNVLIGPCDNSHGFGQMPFSTNTDQQDLVLPQLLLCSQLHWLEFFIDRIRFQSEPLLFKQFAGSPPLGQISKLNEFHN